MDTTVLDAIDRCILHRIPFIAYSLPEDSGTTFFADPYGGTASSASVEISFFGTDAPTVRINAAFTAEDIDSTLTDRSLLPPNIHPHRHSTTREQHRAAVEAIVTRLQSNGGKTVLSRAIAGTRSSDDWRPVISRMFDSSLFAFRFVYYTRDTGCWIGASPELLGMTDADGMFTTMALAGTRTGRTPWDDKNIEEHRIVVDYIVDRLTAAGLCPSVGETESVKCGPVEHLRHIITAPLCNPSAFTGIIRLLSPTPALAGYPLRDALADITELEAHPRQCYGGYIALTTPDGARRAYVNLRSCHFECRDYCIYAGGGITAQSDPDAEWLETQAKASTLLSLIG